MSWAGKRGMGGTIGASYITRCNVCGGWALKMGKRDKVCKCSAKVCVKSWAEVPDDKSTLFIWRERQKS